MTDVTSSAPAPKKDKRVRLSAPFLEAKQNNPPARRRQFWDDLQAGLVARITPKGVVSFVVVKRRRGDRAPTYTTLGRFPDMKVADARDKALDALRQLADGERPLDVARAQREAERQTEAVTFEAVVVDFIKRHLHGEPRKRTAKNIESLIRRRLLGQRRNGDEWVADTSVSLHWRKRPFASITRRDVIVVVQAFKDEGHAVQAKKLLTFIVLIFNWAINEACYGIEVNPASKIDSEKIVGKMRSRERQLTDLELRYVWCAAQTLSYPFGDLVCGLMLVPYRLRELAELSHPEIGHLTIPATVKTASSPSLPEIKCEAITIPAERSKNGDAFVIPLAPTMQTLVAGLPTFKCGDFKFTTTAGRVPVSGFSGAARNLNREIARLRAADGLEPMPSWVWHDLRRTIRSKLAALGVTDRVAEKLQGHKIKGIEGTYNRYTYHREMLAALTLWEGALANIVAAPAAPEARRA